jgi:RNA polymerase sigma-70 factor (ECF subfamily)
MDPSTHRALLQRRFAAGDDRALEAWDHQLRGRMISHARRLAGVHDAEDVVQSAMIEAWRRRDRYDQGRPIEPWLLTIVRRRAIDHLRRHARASAATLPSVDPVDVADRVVDTIDLRRALADLPPREREAVTMAYYGGLSQSEVADALDTPLGTVKTRTARGLRRLADSIR